MQGNTSHAAAAAIDPERLSDLFVVDAALRRLSECLALQASPLPGFAVPALSRDVLQMIIGDLADRMATCTHALLAMQAVRP